ncbi:MAG: molybdenum cofactor biosynthesis protein MoaE [Sphingomonadales bacterium]|jgi:molybdopterin synthase catalytic subunit|nr:molybdenum cofactor biosynthesis protein MoaE [Sphingomonadales bacterium]WRH75766.1 MAG: molybdenum cofactor biosynthesis protein MoaE [Sphingobium sp.]
MITVRIQRAAFDTAAEIAALDGEAIGAVATFTGIVRRDGGVDAIELEHYPGMTEASLAQVCEDAMRRWQLAGCTIIHRVGRMTVGEAIVLVVTASSHRANALEACAYLIDRLKTDAPFWKKEFRDGAAIWVEAKDSDMARAERWDQ